MSVNNRDPESRTRRAILMSGVGLAGSWLLPGTLGRALAQPKPATSTAPRDPAVARQLSPATVALLEKSDFVYVSPLKANGQESACHGEVWYGWDEGSVALITARKTWKGRALDRGLDRARVWVGNHGRWKGLIFNNEDFRRGPSFEARAAIDPDPALLERLMQRYAVKYPAEFADWEPAMRSGFVSGERVIIRYSPV